MPKTSAEKSEIHNRASKEALRVIFEAAADENGRVNWPEAMVIAESVVMGMFLAGVRTGGDAIILETMFEDIRMRLALGRLEKTEPQGSA